MQDLFIEDTNEGFEKTAGAELNSFELPHDATKWVEEILSIFTQLYPFLQEQPLSITWRKKNPDKGYGVGYINILNGAVPVIVNNFVMSPVDVLMTPDGVSIPLHPEFIQELMSDPSAFKGLYEANKKSNEMLFNSHLQFSPVTEYGDGNAYRSNRMVKSASVLDSLSFAHRDDVIELISELQDENVRDSFEKNGTFDVFLKLKDKAFYNTKEASIKDILRNSEIDRQLVYSDDFGNRFVKQANSKFDKTWTVKLDTLDEQGLDSLLVNNKTVEKIAERTEKEEQLTPVMIKEGHVGSWHSGGETSSEIAPEMEVISIKKVNDPKVFSAPVRGKTAEAIIFDEDGTWTTREKIAYCSLSFNDLPGNDINVGDFGVFALEGAVTEPFEVSGMVKGAGVGNFKIKGERGFNSYTFFPIKTESDDFEKVADLNNTFYIPGNAKFIKLARPNDKLKDVSEFEAKVKIEGLNGFNKVAVYLSETADKATKTEKGDYILPGDSVLVQKGSIEKIASEKYNSKHFVHKDGAGLYRLEGPQFEKYAKNHPIQNLNELDTKWAVIHCGGTETDVEKIATLNNNRTHSLEGELSSPMDLQTLDEKLAKITTESTESGRLKIATNLVKVAAHIRDKTVVDAVLSLNLLRKKNVMEYLAVLPMLEASLSELGKLLLASRLGLANTRPDDVKEAMDSLTEVILQLSKLKASIKEVN